MKAESGITVLNVSVGLDHSCALLVGGKVMCWGTNSVGQLGDDTTINRHLPVFVSGITNATAISAGLDHTCALLADHTVQCWGNNGGNLGDGTETRRLTPVAVSEIDNAVEVKVGDKHSCALLSNGSVKCWGQDYQGQLGDGGALGRSLTPVAVSGFTNAIAIDAGAVHTCALLSTGGIQCWGENVDGQLGNGTSQNYRLTPVAVVGIDNAVAISGGQYYTCALLTGGSIKCWGDNYYGQLGDGSYRNDRISPVAVSGIATAMAFSAGLSHTCAVLTDGSVKCWGYNLSGLLGDGTELNYRLTPVTVSGINNAIAIDAGYNHSCVALSDGGAKCWAYNEFGQLGDGTTMKRLTPVSVIFPQPLNHAPIITLLGDNPLTITQGSVFADPGATAYDEENGDRTANIIKTGTVDNETIGTYELTYRVTDLQGLEATPVIRTVVVEPVPVTADAGENITIKSSQRCGTIIQGLASSTVAADLEYRWREGDVILLDWSPVGRNGEAPLSLCPLTLTLGEHDLALDVRQGNVSASNNMILTIGNSAPNAAPEGSGVYEFGAPISVSGQVSDFDTDTLAFSWHEGATLFDCSGTVQVPDTSGNPIDLPQVCLLPDLALGFHTITLTVGDGVNDPVSSDILVQVTDTTAPTLAPKVNRTLLWPPNHKMVDITIDAHAGDSSGLSVILSASVASNEAQEGLGDGDTPVDWTSPVIDQATGMITFQLRAERSGSGNGRTYTITVSATDSSGNINTTNQEIIVPHSKSNK